MGDVLEYLVDGTSGISPGGVEGSAIVAGVCSKGQVGKGYLLGPSSDLEGLLGVGPLVERARDMLATGGQSPTLIAVPCTGEAKGYFTDIVTTGGNGSYPEVTVSGVPQDNLDIVVQVESAGQVGTATVKVSTDGGKLFESAVTATQQFVIEDSGATLLFPEDAQLEEGWQWAFSARLPIGPVSLFGDEGSPLPTVAGTVLAGADISIQIVKGGARNEGTYQLSTDGGENYGKTRTIPVDGAVPIAEPMPARSWNLKPASLTSWLHWKRPLPCMTLSSSLWPDRRTAWTGRPCRLRRKNSGTCIARRTSRRKHVFRMTGKT